LLSTYLIQIYVGKIGLEEVGFLYCRFYTEFLCWNHFYCNEYGLFSEIVFYSDDNVKVRLFSNRSFQFDYNANSNPFFDIYYGDC
jgi:hypothetical protein